MVEWSEESLGVRDKGRKKVLATNLLAVKFDILPRFLHKPDEFFNPRPMLDLIYCLSYCGYTLLLLFILINSITYKISVGKHIRFYNVLGIILYSGATLSLITSTITFFDVIGVLTASLLILTLALDATNQF